MFKIQKNDKKTNINKIPSKKKNNSPKKFSTFMLCGMLLLIIIVTLIYFLIIYYKPEYIVKYSGYAVKENVIEKNLKAENVEEVEKYVEMVKVEESSQIFKKINTYYVGGENQKEQITIQYPIYVNGRTSIYNILGDMKLITVNYEEVEGYPEFVITEGVMYNGDDLTRADSNEYLFLKNEEDIYINTKEITIKTSNEEYKIPEYSTIYFEEGRINYYETQEGIMEFKSIGNMDKTSNILLNGTTMTYEEFLIKMGIVQEEKENVRPNKTEETSETKPTESTETPETEPTEEPVTEPPVEENGEQNQGENQYIKPSITMTEIEANVYTLTGKIEIQDPVGAIYKLPIIEIRKNGRIYKRVQIKASGTIEITGLSPDTEFEITGIMYYKDENGKEQEETFIEETIQTQKFDILGTVKLNFENGEIFSRKIQLTNLKIENDIQEEVVKGIYTIELNINDTKYSLKREEVSKVTSGEEITYETQETIKSNSKIEYEIKVYDRYGNELKVENNKGETRTSKQTPSVNITLKSQDTTQVLLELKLRNEDNVELNNYGYTVYNMKNEEVEKGTLKKSQSNIALTSLDPNDYYNIQIYADCDLNDGKGTQEKLVIGEGRFTTLTISSLGYVRLDIENTELTQNNAKFSLSINNEVTDGRLTKILSYLELRLVPQEETENVGDQETRDDDTKATKSIVLSSEELEKLKQGEELELNYETLDSSTKYKIEAVTKAKQGTVEEDVENMHVLEEITTLKIPAEVQIRNQITIANMLDFDIRVEDIDGAILNNKVIIELRREDNGLVEREEIETNQEYVRKIYDGLEEEKRYYLKIYAGEYNEGSTDVTYQSNYLLKEIEIYTEFGITGEIGLNNLSRKATGKNLVNVESENNWYVYPNFNTWDYYGKEYNKETNELKLGGNNNYRRVVYDLREYAGQEVTISFKIKYVDETNTGTIYIQNAKTDKNYTQITEITGEYTEKQYTLNIDESGYLGFYIIQGSGIYIKDLQVELGNTKTSYQEFKYTMNAKYQVNLEDKNDEISTNDYYIKIYKNGEQIKEERYEEIGENNKVENSIKEIEVETNSSYKIELTVKIRDRYYVLDTIEFETGEGEEIKGISSKEEFLEIQPRGNYIVLNDIDLSGMTGYTLRFGSENLRFEGKIDFNGKKLIRDASTNAMIFHTIGENGIIENIVLEIKLNNVSTLGNFTGLFTGNYGAIKNIQLNLMESNDILKYTIRLLGDANYKIIENFVINYQEPLYGFYNLLVLYHNYGTIKNGYIIGENIQINYDKTDTQGRNTSTLVINNSQNGEIYNVYSLVSVDVENYGTNENISNLIVNNSDNAKVRNVYSVGIGKNGYDQTNISSTYGGPNVYNISYANNANIENNYYMADKMLETNKHEKITALNLHDVEFQNKVLNSENAFNVDDAVTNGYYPQLNMPEVMPKQEYIELPEIKDADLADILDSEVIEQGTSNVKVKFRVHNPSAEQITEIKIENINVRILSQEYNEGISEVIVELYDPIKYISEYNVQSITVKGAYNTEYTRDYEQGEKIVKADLYKEINSVQDWKNINTSLTENYMLMTDLNFINEGNTIQINNTFTGKINGNNHKISNLNLTNAWLIGNLQGTLENLYIENFNFEKTTSDNRMGLIRYAQNATINNVHIKGVKLESKVNVQIKAGVIVAQANGGNVIITNSSAVDVEIVQDVNEIVSQNRIGGLVGYFNGSRIENCYTRDINLNIGNAIETAIGGIAGYVSKGDITNCYAEGKIEAVGPRVGGITGYNENPSSITVTNCYSYVEIVNTEEYVGGIIGKDPEGASNATNTHNNLSIGNIYTGKQTENIGRIVSNYTDRANNYAYESQKINGYITEEELGATLLSYEELCQKETYTNTIQLGEAYDYSKVNEGILPKLYNTQRTELLPNQEDIKIEETEEMIIEKVTSDKTDANTIEALIEISNSQEKEIVDIEVEDMEVTITKNNTENGKTYIEIKATPTRYYDSYKVSKIIYKENGEEKEQETSARIEEQFYKELYSYEDWQGIEEGTYQNYKLMNDIDFSGRDNIKSNVTMSRLESNGSTLKNIEIEVSGDYAGLIREIRTNLDGVNFENIKVTGKNSYVGVIGKSTAEVKNIKFKDITVTTPYDYVGSIGWQEIGKVENIELENITITGRSNIGGLIGRSLSKITNIQAKTINIESSGNYTGGIAGYYNSNKEDSKNLKVINIKIKSNGDIVGGIFGYLGSNNKKLEYVEIENAEISGKSNIGGILGQQSATTVQYSNVVNIKLVGITLNSENIGGITGKLNHDQIIYSSVINSEISSKGNNVGGIAGWSSRQIYSSFVKDTKVEGVSRVGGIVGEITLQNIHDVYTNAEVKAIEKDAGGLIGYCTNDKLVNIIQIYTNSVEGAKIEAPENVGGLIGYIEDDLYTQTNSNYYKNNYVQAYLTSEDTETVSLGIGSSKKENDKLTNFHVYKYSKINDQYISEDIDNVQESQFVTADQLKQENTYKNTFGWGTNYLYTTLSENKYPILNSMQTEQEGIDLPEDPIDAETMQANIQQIAENIENKIPLSINSLITENGATEQTNSEQNNNIVTTPTYEIYPITANEINIDLNNVPEGTYLRIGQGENTVDIEIDSRTYTFKYDFKTPQTLQLIQKSTNNASLNTTSTQTESTAKQTTSTDATNTNTETILAEIKIEPEEIRNSASLDGETNAILKGTEMYINGEKIYGGFVNIYKGKALTENGEIYDIESQEKDQSENKVEGLILESKVKPREEYEYSGNEIKVYGKYSTINGQVKNQIYTVKNGKLSIISGKTELKIGNQVIDMINDREYETILLENGTIQDLKQSLKYPENFENSNIKEIVQNSDTERPEVLVYYNNGTVIVFNYLTGDIIYQQEIKQNIGLVDYIKQSLANIIPSSTNKTSKEYEESKELVEKLEEKPVEEALQEVKPNNGTNTQNTEVNIGTEEITQETNSSINTENTQNNGTINNGNSLTSIKNYVTSYNPETGLYEVYSIEEIIESSEEEPESETQKIQANGLQQFYESYNTSGKKTKIEPGLVIIITTITAIGILSIAIIRRAK